MVDTVNHWGSVYLSTTALARGWDRQVDNSENPIFYDADLLTSASYESWLHQLAVGWVAVPSAPLDYASVDEARLIRTGLSYLTLTWSSSDWRLYRVNNATPLVSGARVNAIEDNGITITTAAQATVSVRMRWSPYLTVRDPSVGLSVPACLTDSEGWIRLFLPRAETVELSSRFDPAARLSGTDRDCVADLLGQ